MKKQKTKPKVLNSFKQLWRLKNAMMPEGHYEQIKEMEDEFDKLIEGKKSWEQENQQTKS